MPPSEKREERANHLVARIVLVAPWVKPYRNAVGAISYDAEYAAHHDSYAEHGDETPRKPAEPHDHERSHKNDDGRTHVRLRFVQKEKREQDEHKSGNERLVSYRESDRDIQEAPSPQPPQA